MWNKIAERSVAEQQVNQGRRDQTWSTTDLGTAAYAHMKGLEISSTTKDSKQRYSFNFRDPEGRGEELQVEYANSCCQRFDSAVRSMKKLIHSTPKRLRGR